MFFSYLLYHYETLSFHIRRWSKSINLALNVLFYVLCLSCIFFPVTLKRDFITLLALEFCVRCVEVNACNECQNILCQKRHSCHLSTKPSKHTIVDRSIKSSTTIFNICCPEVVETTKLKTNATNSAKLSIVPKILSRSVL